MRICLACGGRHALPSQCQYGQEALALARVQAMAMDLAPGPPAVERTGKIELPRVKPARSGGMSIRPVRRSHRRG
jgi:hypothetical protein